MPINNNKDKTIEKGVKDSEKVVGTTKRCNEKCFRWSFCSNACNRIALETMRKLVGEVFTYHGLLQIDYNTVRDVEN